MAFLCEKGGSTDSWQVEGTSKGMHPNTDILMLKLLQQLTGDTVYTDVDMNYIIIHFLVRNAQTADIASKCYVRVKSCND